MSVLKVSSSRRTCNGARRLSIGVFGGARCITRTLRWPRLDRLVRGRTIILRTPVHVGSIKAPNSIQSRGQERLSSVNEGVDGMRRCSEVSASRAAKGEKAEESLVQ